MATPDTPSRKPLSMTLVGTWELLTREDYTHGGERRIDPGLGANPIALIFFDAKGNFAAQFMKRDRRSETGADPVKTPPNNSRARGGYDAYFGTYTVDDVAGTVTTRQVGALSPENVGQLFVRAMSVEGDNLTIRLETARPDGEPILRTLRWKRVG